MRTARKISPIVADAADYPTTQVLTAITDADLFKVKPEAAAPGLKTSGVTFHCVLLDTNGDPVPPAGCTVSITVVEIDSFGAGDPAANKRWASRCDKIADNSPVEDQFSADGFFATAGGGGLFFMLTAVANVPGAATSLWIRAKEH